MQYWAVPLLAWLVAGSLKFAINYFKFGKEAKERIGNGGFPSNHTSIVTTITMYIGFHDGFNTPMFGLGIALIMIVVIDATGLRRYVGNHAASINKLQSSEDKKHRQSIGHTKIEVLGGLVLGIVLGFILNQIS